MSNTNHNICIADSETANFVNSPLPYDFGYTIVNPRTWEIIKARSFVIQEIFMDKNLMSSAYYAKKVPQYWEDIKAGKREMKRITTIKRIVAEDFKKYHVTMVGAYNMAFDKRACNNGIRYTTYSAFRWFFPYDVEFFDIWHGACSSFLRSKHFINWATKNGYVSPKGNIQTTAEVAYRYITKNTGFEESHTGLEDVLIELEILKKIYRCKMKFDFTVVGSPWRIVQEYSEEMGL